MKKTPLARKTPLRATRRPKAAKNVAKRLPGANKKIKTQAQLKKELDAIFSKYIRLKHSDSNGNVACYTCGKVMHWKQIQNGHFISRQYLATRWHEDNCRPQCIGCNIFGNGKVLDFEEKLKAELGAEYVEDMKRTRHTSLKLDRIWYMAQIEKFTVDKLEKLRPDLLY